VSKSLLLASPGTSKANAVVFAGIGCSNVDQQTNGTVEADMKYRVRAPGTVRNLCVRTAATTAGGITVLSRKNGANGNLTVTINTSSSGFFSDTVNADTLAAGDDFCWSWNDTNGQPATITAEFDPTGAQVSFLESVSGGASGAGEAITTASSTRYQSFGGAVCGSADIITTEANVQSKMRAAGTASHLQAFVHANARTTTTTINYRKGGVIGAQVLTIGSTASGLFEDTTHTDAVASGDLISAGVVTLTGTASLALSRVGILITSNNESIDLIGQTGFPPGAGANFYTYIGGRSTGGGTMLTTESGARAQVPFPASFKNMRCYVQGTQESSPGTLKFRKNAAAALQTVTLTAATSGWFEDVTNTDTLNALDDCDLAFTYGGGANGPFISSLGVTMVGPVTVQGGQGRMFAAF
jgi:hypothetical protein